MIKGKDPLPIPDNANLGQIMELYAQNGVRLNQSNIALDACQEFLAGQ